jgi:abortive infection bacteriophage resistance protein
MVAQRKPWICIKDQIKILQNRGMSITDPDKAERYLRNINYYRLSGYWHAFRKSENRVFSEQFVDGTCFSNIVDLYYFDKRLRLTLLDAIERIEIAIRTNLCHLLGEYDPIAHLDTKYLNSVYANQILKSGKTRYQEWQQNHTKQINRRKTRSTFIQHNIKKYGDELSVWVACEAWDFGLLSHMFKMLKPEDKTKISLSYNIASGVVLESWIHTINDIRNICSHHDRLWNNKMKIRPKYHPLLSHLHQFKDNHDEFNFYLSRVFTVIIIINEFIKAINPTSKWVARINSLINDFPSHDNGRVNLIEMGVPDNWQEYI